MLAFAVLVSGVADDASATNHFWPLNEPVTADTVLDAAGDLDSIIVHNGPNPVPGICDPNDPAARFWDEDGPTWIVFPHDDSLLLSEGSISFCFIDTTKILDAGIISKDSDGFDSGGHLTIGTTKGSNVLEGQLFIRLQDTAASYTVSAPIVADQPYRVVFNFGPGGMELWINNVLADTNAYTGGLLGNFEPLVFGASTAWSGNLTHTPLRNYWSGILDDVRISHVRQQIPEPASLTLLAGAAGLLLRRRR